MKIASFLILVAATLTGIQSIRVQALQPEVLYNFPLGPRYPDCRPVQAIDGSFLGTTTQGGPHDAGTAFKLSGDGLLTTLVSFNGTNGASPQGALVLDNGGNIYGTTSGGGTNGKGTVFRVTTNGVLTTLASFNGPDCCVDPGGLFLGSDGNFYGTTRQGNQKPTFSRRRPFWAP